MGNIQQSIERNMCHFICSLKQFIAWEWVILILSRHSGTGEEWGLGAGVGHEDCLEKEKREWEPADADAHNDIRTAMSNTH